MSVDPADIRFTQDSINPYFQYPYSDFSIRQAVRRIAKKKWRPDEFPPIRVISYDGCLWSIDNRRLWVFRFARCKSICVRVLKKMHHRLHEIIANPDSLRIMAGADFFPKVRDRGHRDRDFDRLYPQPSSLQPSRNSHSQIHGNNERTGGTTSPTQTPPERSTAKDQAKPWAARAQMCWELWRAVRKTIYALLASLGDFFGRASAGRLLVRVASSARIAVRKAVNFASRLYSNVAGYVRIAARKAVNFASRLYSNVAGSVRIAARKAVNFASKIYTHVASRVRLAKRKAVSFARRFFGRVASFSRTAESSTASFARRFSSSVASFTHIARRIVNAVWNLFP